MTCSTITCRLSKQTCNNPDEQKFKWMGKKLTILLSTLYWSRLASKDSLISLAAAVVIMLRRETRNLQIFLYVHTCSTLETVELISFDNRTLDSVALLDWSAGARKISVQMNVRVWTSLKKDFSSILIIFSTSNEWCKRLKWHITFGPQITGCSR